MKIIRISCILIFLLSGKFLNAQEKSYTLTLSEACKYALEHNKTLLNSRDQITSSKEKMKETVAQGLPQIEGSLDYMTYFNYEMNLNFGSSSGTPVDYSQDPYDDGDRALAMSLASMLGSSEPIIMSDQFSGKVQFTQLIFSGQYIAGIQTAKIARRLADQSLSLNELDVKENVTNSYYIILTTEQTLQIISENLINLNTVLQHTNNMYHAGIAEETDVDQLKITVSQLKNSQNSLERMNQLNYNMLKFQLGVAPDIEITLADSLDQMTGKINPDSTVLNGFNIEDNINYQLMESQVLLSKKQVDMQNWTYAPSVAGFYSYTEKFLTTGFDMTPNHVAGISLSVPIFSSGMRRSRVSQAKINLDIAQRNQDMINDQLEMQQRQLVFNYENALENFNTQKENVSIAKRVYTKIQNKYEQGLASSLDLTQANSNYLNAESNYLSSVLTLLQAKTSLDKLYNRL